MNQVHAVTPFVMTHDLAASVNFFEGTLGFSCGFHMEGYAFLRRDKGAIRGLQVETGCAIAQQLIYLDCADVDALYAALKPGLDCLDAGRVRAPFDQPYGMREFHVKDPNNAALMFGMDIPPSP